MAGGRRRRVAVLGIAWSLASGCGESPATVEECGPSVAAIALDPFLDPSFVRLRDGTTVDVSFSNACGEPVAGGAVSWTSSDPTVAAVSRQESPFGEEVGFVQAVGFGSATVRATLAGVSADLDVEVSRPETDASGFTVLGYDTIANATTDLWVHGDWAYSGSAPWDGCADASCAGPGTLYVWRLEGDAGVTLADSVSLPASRVNDVKVSPDGRFMVTSQEAGPAENGIVVLDLADPASPRVASHFTDQLEGGVHNVWVEPLGGRDYVFVVENGTTSGGLHVVDVTDLSSPRRVGFFRARESKPHDVYVRDGLAFVSWWDAGLIILDVGNGIAGGSPDSPREVGRVVTANGHVHNAWYWPERGLVFVGEERGNPEDALDVGIMHVVDASDLSDPREVATFGVAGTTPHNFWLDEERGLLFAAWYDKGVRVIDVDGDLAGDLAAQGREVAHVLPSGSRGAGSIWAPQLHRGRVYASDIVHGIWAFRFER